MIISKRKGSNIYHETWCPYAKKIQLKYRRNVDIETAKECGYKECRYCGGMHGTYKTLIRDPGSYGKMRRKFAISYDRKDNALCFRSDIGFWKILRNNVTGKMYLYHLNKSNFSPNVSDKYLMRRLFHRQTDVAPTSNLARIIQYIYEHDKAKRMMWDGDYRKLPQKTKKQKQYYKKARQKQIRKEINRVNDIFAKLEREEQIKNG